MVFQKSLGRDYPSPSRRWMPKSLLQTNAKVMRCAKAVMLITLFFAAWQLWSYPTSFRTYRQALTQKYSPTRYNSLTKEDEELLHSQRWRWDEQDGAATQIRGSYSRADLWANRHRWQKLGSGFEGKTFKYGGTVIKSFRARNAPFRNCVPGVAGDEPLRWPTEISAQLVLSGLAESDSIPADATFLPTVDYFLGPDSTRGWPEWYLVTPLLPSGNLEQLARQLRRSDRKYTARDVDIIFRPSLEQVLGILDTMHTTKELCHDDIKLDNVMSTTTSTQGSDIDNPEKKTHWLLGDLGNVRQPSHPYHSSILWWKFNNNLQDCRENDVVRLLKSYIIFLRASVDNVAAFDEEFFQGLQPWSRLFWATIDDAAQGRNISAAFVGLQSQLHNRANNLVVPSTRYTHEPPRSSSLLFSAFVGREGRLAKAVADSVRISASEKKARNWSMSWLLGIPVAACGTQGGSWREELPVVDGMEAYLE
ncbi:hypothetical protein S40288_01518 [Stachybotrys chartarum IBT 40288]|nr:hypothetical protein S40288_01518 [Stachybotrys chartarum IBT 40288]